MADHLARIVGTEEDRHGDHCSRTHFRPAISTTIILKNLYENPPVALAIAEGQDVNDEAADICQDQFEEFYEELWTRIQEYGEIEQLICCDNIGDHMIGNIYVKFATEADAENAMKKLVNSSFNNKRIVAEFSPVTDFRDCRCKQFIEGNCTRGGYCNFMHLKHVPRSLKKKLINKMYEKYPNYTVNRNSPIDYIEREKNIEFKRIKKVNYSYEKDTRHNNNNSHLRQDYNISKKHIYLNSKARRR